VRLAEWTIESPSAQLLLVALLVGVADTSGGGLASAPANRLASARLIERLKRLPLAELERAAATGSLELVVRLDADRVAWSVHAAARTREKEALLEYFVRHGAPRALLRELFGASRQRVAKIRRAQRLRSTQGRPKLPSRKEREAIEATWMRLGSATADLRSRYRELHRAFPHHALAALAAVVRETESRALDLDLPPGKGSRDDPVSARPGPDNLRVDSRRGEIVHRRDRE
jgi:hypothetical protein